MMLQHNVWASASRSDSSDWCKSVCLECYQCVYSLKSLNIHVVFQNLEITGRTGAA